MFISLGLIPLFPSLQLSNFTWAHAYTAFNIYAWTCKVGNLFNLRTPLRLLRSATEFSKRLRNELASVLMRSWGKITRSFGLIRSINDLNVDGSWAPIRTLYFKFYSLTFSEFRCSTYLWMMDKDLCSTLFWLYESVASAAEPSFNSALQWYSHLRARLPRKMETYTDLKSPFTQLFTCLI